jgi:hypothetical protein
MEEKMKLFKVLVGKPEGKTMQRLRRRWEDKMKWVLGRLTRRVLGGFTWLRIGTGDGGSCEHGNEPSGSGTNELVSYFSAVTHLLIFINNYV